MNDSNQQVSLDQQVDMASGDQQVSLDQQVNQASGAGDCTDSSGILASDDNQASGDSMGNQGIQASDVSMASEAGDCQVDMASDDSMDSLGNEANGDFMGGGSTDSLGSTDSMDSLGNEANGDFMGNGDGGRRELEAEVTFELPCELDVSEATLKREMREKRLQQLNYLTQEPDLKDVECKRIGNTEKPTGHMIAGEQFLRLLYPGKAHDRRENFFCDLRYVNTGELVKMTGRGIPIELRIIHGILLLTDLKDRNTTAKRSASLHSIATGILGINIPRTVDYERIKEALENISTIGWHMTDIDGCVRTWCPISTLGKKPDDSNPHSRINFVIELPDTLRTGPPMDRMRLIEFSKSDPLKYKAYFGVSNINWMTNRTRIRSGSGGKWQYSTDVRSYPVLTYKQLKDLVCGGSMRCTHRKKKIIKIISNIPGYITLDHQEIEDPVTKVVKFSGYRFLPLEAALDIDLSKLNSRDGKAVKKGRKSAQEDDYMLSQDVLEDDPSLPEASNNSDEKFECKQLMAIDEEWMDTSPNWNDF